MLLRKELRASDTLSKGSNFELYAQAEYLIINTLPHLPTCYWGLDLESHACRARYMSHMLEQGISIFVNACLGGSMEKGPVRRLGPYCFFSFPSHSELTEPSTGLCGCPLWGLGVRECLGPEGSVSWH